MDLSSPDRLKTSGGNSVTDSIISPQLKRKNTILALAQKSSVKDRSWIHNLLTEEIKDQYVTSDKKVKKLNVMPIKKESVMVSLYK